MAVNHPAVRINFDTGNISFYTDGGDAVVELEKIAPYVACTHLKDHDGEFEAWHFRTLGEGIVDFTEVLRILKSVDYTGPYILQPEGVRGKDLTESQTKERIEKSFEHLRQARLRRLSYAGSMGTIKRQNLSGYIDRTHSPRLKQMKRWFHTKNRESGWRKTRIVRSITCPLYQAWEIRTGFANGRGGIIYSTNSGPKGATGAIWGIAAADDLVHWRDLPPALYPDTELHCFSGQTLVEDDRVVAIYHGKESGNSTATATDPLLLNWEKHPDNPVIPNLKTDEYERPYNVFDPCIWKEEDGYYSISGTSIDGYIQGTAPLCLPSLPFKRPIPMENIYIRC